jgi:hypothetical protein
MRKRKKREGRKMRRRGEGGVGMKSGSVTVCG